jgi:hypothetical protein
MIALSTWPDRNEALLAVILPYVLLLDEEALEYRCRCYEVDASACGGHGTLLLAVLHAFVLTGL